LRQPVSNVFVRSDIEGCRKESLQHASQINGHVQSRTSVTGLSNDKLEQVVQTLDARYIEGAAMVALLIRLFGRGNFSINVRFLRLLVIFNSK
jgi:hypothetical protein